MRRIFYILAAVSLLFIYTLGCSPRGQIKEKVSELNLIYISNLPDDEQGWSKLKIAVDAVENHLVLVDDTAFASVESMAWWEGEKELFLLKSLGCDLFFPPFRWLLFISPPKLAALASRADFFLVSVNAVDEKNNYFFSKYMIRQQSPYRIAFTASLPLDSNFANLGGIKMLPLDSIVPVTSQFVLMQSDFLFFVNHSNSHIKNMPAGAFELPAGGNNRLIEYKFVSRFNFKQEEKILEPTSAYLSDSGIVSPLALWAVRRDSLDSRVLGNCDAEVVPDSLEKMILAALRKITKKNYASKDIGIFISDNFVRSGLPAGNVTFGELRKFIQPEIFVLMSLDDISNTIESLNGKFYADKKAQWGLFPLSIYLKENVLRGKKMTVTGITSAQIAKNLFPELKEEDEK